jgi:hypothetical protein
MESLQNLVSDELILDTAVDSRRLAKVGKFTHLKYN